MPTRIRLVLKWETQHESQVLRRDGVDLAERLRTAAGWPVPRTRGRGRGILLVLQDFIDG